MAVEVAPCIDCPLVLQLHPPSFPLRLVVRPLHHAVSSLTKQQGVHNERFKLPGGLQFSCFNWVRSDLDSNLHSVALLSEEQ